MKSYLERYFPGLFGKKLGGIIEPAPEPQIVKHVTVVEVKFTDLTKVLIYCVMKNHAASLLHAHWLPEGFTDRVQDVHPFVGDRQYRINMMWGYRSPGAGFNNLFMLDKVEAAPRLPMRID